MVVLIQWTATDFRTHGIVVHEGGVGPETEQGDVPVITPSTVRRLFELRVARLCPQGFGAVFFPDATLHVIGMEGSRAVRPDLTHGDELVVAEPIDANGFVLRICGNRSKL